MYEGQKKKGTFVFIIDQIYLFFDKSAELTVTFKELLRHEEKAKEVQLCYLDTA